MSKQHFIGRMAEAVTAEVWKKGQGELLLLISPELRANLYADELRHFYGPFTVDSLAQFCGVPVAVVPHLEADWQLVRVIRSEDSIVKSSSQEKK